MDFNKPLNFKFGLCVTISALRTVEPLRFDSVLLTKETNK